MLPLNIQFLLSTILSIFFYSFWQAAVHLGNLWHGLVERRSAGGDVQSVDREDQHRHLSALVEGGRGADGKSARFCDGRQRQETVAGGGFAGGYLLLRSKEG